VLIPWSKVPAALLAGALLAAVPGAPARAADAMPTGIDWLRGGNGTEVDAAFARARAERKPLFLYWGAVWCPPCNQVKATIFSRADFIERARHFVPVYVDGDAAGAQALGSRFKVNGYPTMILFRADGSEITRLPGEVDGSRYMQVLGAGLAGGQPVKSLLAAAQAGRALPPAHWQQLAFYSWDTDEQALLPKAQRSAALWKLAQSSVAAAPDASARLALKAMLVAARDKPAADALDKRAALVRLRAAIADPRVARAVFPELGYGADTLPALLTEAGSPARGQLLAEWDRRMTAFANDGSLARLDRIAAAGARVGLARVTLPKGALPLALQTEVRAVTLLAMRSVTDRYEREAVATAAADVLADAGLLDESDALLQAELKVSATPYYHMLGLASNARKRGDSAAALGWHERAWQASQGPATRLQWGGSYLRALLDLAPDDADRIERTARAVLGELAPQPESFSGRNAGVLERLGGRLAEWNKDKERDGRRDAVIGRLRAQLDPLCRQLPPSAERDACSRVLDGRARGA
jgi:thiol-disulfide isomerase/thioredoxin